MPCHASVRGAVVALALTGLIGADARAQTTHVHYTQPEGPPDQAGADGALAPRLQNLGTHAFPVTVKTPQAQLFMNQGLNLAYGFNHAESGRAFREAARLDPECAMAYWGQALVLGPNINALMDPKEEPVAFELVQKAVSLKANASDRERALIDALAKRYTGKPEERSANDKAYAAAMGEVARRFADDLDIQTLYVESMMDTMPWKYWMPDGTPYPGTNEIVALTESVIKRGPDHPGALHLHIHLLESTDTPERALDAADRLMTLMPAAGHMVHMPSHIYQRVGRYDLSIKSNQLAVAADEDYITQCRAQGLYPMGYYPHNLHFLWWAATYDGQSTLAIESARKLAGKVPDAALAELPLLAGFKMVPYYALTRFARWDEMLKEPKPPDVSPFLNGIWHYSRGLAFLAKKQVASAEKELAALKALLADKRLEQPLFSPNTMHAVLSIAPEVLGGEISAARKDYPRAIAHLERAVRLEGALVYTEPTEWHYPPRHALGAVLLAAGRPAEAETVYWEDLRVHPDNGWALYGVVQALKAQKKDDQAAVIEARFQKAWSRSDVQLSTSRFGASPTQVAGRGQ